MKNEEKLKTLFEPFNENEACIKKYSEHLCELLEEIDERLIGEEFSDAKKSGELARAVSMLAAYYRAKPHNTLPEISAEGEYDLDAARRAALGYMREVNVDWYFEGGEIDFNFDPTEIIRPVNHEWLWQFNRQNYWRIMSRAYVASGDECLTEAFERQLLTWIRDTYIPKGDDVPWNKPKSTWRTIECGIRLLRNWQIAYDGFRRSGRLSDLALLLMIASMRRQAEHLVKNPTKGNWLMMEMNGVYTFSALFPELRRAEEYRKFARERLTKALSKQILPDGMHNELTPDYQFVTFNCAANFYSIARFAGFEDEIPKEYPELLKKTVDAAIKLATPALTQPRTNDTYTINTSMFTRRAEQLFGKNPEYSFVNTDRKEGYSPEYNSVYLPYAGLAVMRSGWEEDALYLSFDVGPLGAAHIHQDKLNINIYKGREELIFDDGGGQYDISRARDIAISGYGHNSLLVDGMAQSRRAPFVSDSPIDAGWVSSDEYDYAYGVYDDEYGDDGGKPVSHKREVRFAKPDLFCVIDSIRSLDGEPHDYELLFQLDTTKTHSLDGFKNAVISDFGREYNILIVPFDEREDEISVSCDSAKEEPEYRGFYNGRNESCLHPATTVGRKIRGIKDFRFTTLLIPVKRGELPKIERKSEHTLDVTVGGRVHRIDILALRD